MSARCALKPFEKPQTKTLDFSVPQFTSSVKKKGNFLLPVNVTTIHSKKKKKETASLNQRVMIQKTWI